jgi:hypothetical protein
MGHWYRRYRATFDRTGTYMSDTGKKGLMAELTITADEARKTVNAMTTLVNDHRKFFEQLMDLVHGRSPAGLAMRNAYTMFHESIGVSNDLMVRRLTDSAISSIDARIGRAEEAFKTFTSRNGQP